MTFRYIRFWNKLTHVKEQSKCNYYRNLINESQGNTKLIWKTIIDIARYKRRPNTCIKHLINEAGEKVTNKAEIGNLINTYFSEVGEKLAADIEDPVISYNFTSTSLIRQQSACFYLKTITATEVLSHIKQLNPAKKMDQKEYH